MKKKTIITDISHEDLSTLLSIALSGSFWAGVDYPKPLKEARKSGLMPNDDCLEDVLASWLLRDDGNYIIIYDSDSDYENEETGILDKNYWKLTLSDIKKGWGQACDQYRGYANRGLPNLDEMDLYDADAVLQMSCFGKIIYG